jgi:hypothetical protein
MTTDWRDLPQYRACVRLLERRGQPLTFEVTHHLAMKMSDVLRQARRELQVEQSALLLRAAYEFLGPARSLLKERALKIEELRRLRMRPAIWQAWSESTKSSDDKSSKPARLERQLKFIEDVGIQEAFDLLELIELSVPAGGPRQRGPAFTVEQNVELLRKLASGKSLRKLANELSYQYPPLPGQNAPAYPPTHGAVRDRRDDIWRHIAAELDGLMPRKASPKRQYAKNPRHGSQFWAKQSVDSADIEAGGGENATLENVKKMVHEFYIRNWHA